MKLIHEIRLAALGLLLFGGGLHAGGPKTYYFDDGHCTVGFRIKHWQVITKDGQFGTFEGVIQYDEKKIENSSVELVIAAASIDSHNELRDKHLRGEDFFDVAHYPTLSFKSVKVEAGEEPGAMLVSGMLTLHGVTLPVVLNARITGVLFDDETGTKRLGFEADTKINRIDYGIAWNKKNKAGTFMVGNEVQIFVSGATVKKVEMSNAPILLPPPEVLAKLKSGRPDAICYIAPLDGGAANGRASFTQEADDVLIEVDLKGLTPGKHGMHIYEHGDCGGVSGSAAGAHFNPLFRSHGKPGTGQRHMGDLGNVVADSKGEAHFVFRDRWMKISGENGILGRALMVHALEDDMKTQPGGNAGPHIACGLITAALR